MYCRAEMKDKRILSKDLTEKINQGKKLIDKIQHNLSKKEEERKVEIKHKELDFEEDEGNQDIIIDEEELLMLKEMKELKREYRDNFNSLKDLK